MSSAIGTAAGIFGWALALIVAMGAISTALGGTPNTFIAAVQAAAPRLIVAGFLVGVLLLVVDRDLAHTALPGGVLLAGAFAWTLQLLPVAGVTGAPAQEGFRILSANLLITNDDVDAIAEDLTAVDADVLVTLETEVATRDALQARLPAYRLTSTGSGERGQWASVWVHERASGNVLGERHLTIGGETLPGIEYRMDDGGPDDDGGVIIHIVGVHLHSPTGEGDTEAWQHELKDLTGHVRSDSAHLVLAGDFNAGSGHPLLSLVLDRVRDAGRTPWGTGTPTWPVFGRGHGAYRWFPPTLDLDHILTGKSLAAKNFRTVRVHGSDHLAVTAEIVERVQRSTSASTPQAERQSN